MRPLELQLIKKSTDILMRTSLLSTFSLKVKVWIYSNLWFACQPDRKAQIVQYQWPHFQMLWTCCQLSTEIYYHFHSNICRWKWSLVKNFEAGLWSRFWGWSLWIWSFGSGTLGAPNENLKPLFSDQIYPQSVGKMVSETNFGHSKVVFSPLYFLFLKIL